MSKTMKRWLERIRVLFGAAFVLAGLVDFLAYTWGRNSPWPWWANLIYMGVGVGLLFPEPTAGMVGWAKELFPWFRPPAHDRRHDDPPGGEA